MTENKKSRSIRAERRGCLAHRVKKERGKGVLLHGDQESKSPRDRGVNEKKSMETVDAVEE